MAGAGVLGASLSAVSPIAAFEVFELDAWLLSGSAGFVQSAIGLLCYQKALRASQASLGWGLGSGIVRMFALIALLFLAIEAGLHPEATALGLVTMYCTMMVAEIAIVARSSTSAPGVA